MEWIGRFFLSAVVYMIFGPVFVLLLVMFWIITGEVDD